MPYPPKHEGESTPGRALEADATETVTADAGSEVDEEQAALREALAEAIRSPESEDVTAEALLAELSEESRARMNASIERGLADVEAGRGVEVGAFLDGLEAENETGEDLAPEDRAALEAALHRGLESVKAGRVHTAEEVLARIRARTHAALDED
jgi:predicted transcriptional regulator